MPYCPFISGNCAHKGNLTRCNKVPAETCRGWKMENERALRELADTRAGVTVDDGE